jgi:hypothetical protein
MNFIPVVGLPLHTRQVWRNGERRCEARKAEVLSALGSPVFDEGGVELLRLKRDILESGIRNLSYFKEATSRITSQCEA